MKDHPWEAAAAFNGCPVIQGKKTRLIYRAMSVEDPLKEPHIKTSIIAQAISADGRSFDKRAPLIVPDQDFDRYGCEDPRVTKIGSTYYIFYTALGGFPFGPENIRVAVALSKDLQTITEKHLVTPFNAKAMALFPEKIGGKMVALVTAHTDQPPSEICVAEFDRPEDMWSPEYWTEWQKDIESHRISIRRRPEEHLELGAPPVKTDKGWLVVYSHIQRYRSNDQEFGIEAVLLDLEDPRKVIGGTKGPFMVPDDYYEHVGQVPHTIFPSGALVRDGKLEVYYGAADTHCAVAHVPLDNLLAALTEKQPRGISRFARNPIISPRPGMLWEARGTINPAAIEIGGKTHILYRAAAADGLSTIGYASSSDGVTIESRPDKPIYFPREGFESRGCEDPRLVEIKDRLYMTYTAYDGVTPRVAVSSIPTKDFLAKKWSSWSKPDVITPPNVANKDAIIFPETFKGKYLVIHRVHESICGDFLDSLDFSKEKVDECIEMLGPRRGMWDGVKVGISTPAIKTDRGWLVFYHGVSWSSIYRVGAVLLDPDDPTLVIARTAAPIFEPIEPYETTGIVPNVVFPCGLVVRNGTIFMYYGGADLVTGVVMMDMEAVLRMLEI